MKKNILKSKQLENLNVNWNFLIIAKIIAKNFDKKAFLFKLFQGFLLISHLFEYKLSKI